MALEALVERARAVLATPINTVVEDIVRGIHTSLTSRAKGC